MIAPGALAGPKNDSFSARADLGKALPAQAVESNDDATQQSGEWFGAEATGHSIWWEWTSPASEMIGVDGNGFYELGTRGGPLVESPSGEGRVAVRVEPTPDRYPGSM